MKRNLVFITLGFALFFLGCNKNESEQDLEAPQIGPAEGRDDVRPRNGEIMPVEKDHAHIRFSVTDNTALGEVVLDIHNTFDGHTHGRLESNGFVALNVRDIYSSSASDVRLRFPEGARNLNVDENLYWEGDASRVQGNVLAGPYDIIISAIDGYGNQTNYADGSNYLARFYIRRPYAPVVDITNLHDEELEGETGRDLDVQGVIKKGDHELSSDIAFIWIRLAEEGEHDHDHGHHHRVLSEDFYEHFWGASNYRNMDVDGDPLPSNDEVNLAELLSGSKSIILPQEHGHYELIIWVEDVNGNITKSVIEVHAEDDH